jgi:ABC-type cobalamin/Fe3+-siderophores transport system ATPase subunit
MGCRWIRAGSVYGLLGPNGAGKTSTLRMMIGITVPDSGAIGKGSETKRLAVVCANADFARAVQSQLEAKAVEVSKLDTYGYRVEIVATPGENTRAALKGRIGDGSLDGYLWLSGDALASRKISYVARETSDFIEAAALQSALKTALLRQELRSRGVTVTDADQLMKGVDLDTISIKGGLEKRAGGPLQFISAIVLVMMLYMTLILYGVAVMRSVLEEKTSRVMEVVLSSATSRELMAGKILGVGAVGLTQIALWVVIWPGRDHARTAGLPQPAFRDQSFARRAAGFCRVLRARLHAVQFALCRAGGDGELRAGGAAVAVPGHHADHRSYHDDDLRDPPAQRAAIDVDVAGAVLRAHPDVYPGGGRDAAAVADRAVRCGVVADAGGRGGAVLAHLPRRHPDVRQETHVAGNREVDSVRVSDLVTW